MQNGDCYSPTGDVDPSKAIIAETSKLIGNSVYGHSIMRKDRHTNVQLTGLSKALKLVNNPLYTSLEEMDDETFEVIECCVHFPCTYDLTHILGGFEEEENHPRSTDTVGLLRVQLRQAQDA